MKSISFSTLPEKLGINPLTGEACAYGMRVLCDLNEDGTALVAAFLGMPGALFPGNWNSMVGTKPALGSVMLTRGVFPSLVRFALFREGFQYVLQGEGNTDATGFNDRDLREYPALSMYLDGSSTMLKQNGGHAQLYRNPRNPAASVGDRNVHQFSGRTT